MPSSAINTASDSMRPEWLLNVRLDGVVASGLAQLSTPSTVQVVLENFPDRSFQGQLTRLDNFAKTKNESPDSLFTAVVEINASEILLTTGMAARAVIWLDTLTQTILIPDSAIFEMDGMPVVFPRGEWPAARPVQLGPRYDGTTMIADGVDADEEISLNSPEAGKLAQPLSWGTYKKFARETRERMKQRFVEILKRSSREIVSESLFVAQAASETETRSAVSIPDCTSVIDRILALPAGSEDSTKNVKLEKMRIGPGEGGKLAPLSPEMRKQMKPGEKISVSIPALRDSLADTAKTTTNQRVKPESTSVDSTPPGRE